MIETVQRPITQSTTEIVAKICDRCKRRATMEDIAEFQEFHHIHVTGGYGSIFGDGITVKVDLCQHCLAEMVKGLGTRKVEGD